MIQTLIADTDPQSVNGLRRQLEIYCPQIIVEGVASSSRNICRLIREKAPQLVFLKINLFQEEINCLLKDPASEFETIFISSGPETMPKGFHVEAGGFLFQPIEAKMLVDAVQRAQHWIQIKQEQAKNRALLNQLLHQSPPNDVIGVPTMEGMEFLKIEEIVRCEGLNSFTRVVLSDGTGIISSYHIGAFRKLLSTYGFFSPHKSHLVNLQYIRKYLLEGTLLLRDGSTVPVARRRRNAFLERIRHL